MKKIEQQMIHLHKYYIDDLLEEVQNQIKIMNKKNFILTDFKFSNLEGNDSDSRAYLLFNKSNVI